MDYREFRARQRSTTLEHLGYLAVTMAYTDVGSGEPVVLLHGIPTWSYLYADVISELEPHCRALAPDFLGHGYSDSRDRFDRSLAAQTGAILAFLDTSASRRRRSSATTPAAESRSSSRSSTRTASNGSS